MADTIDPFKFIGKPETWGKFGEGEDDEACDAERRALADHFIRRIKRAVRRGTTPANALIAIFSGASTAMAGVWFGMQDGPSNAKPDDFERFVGVLTLSYYQALSAYDAEGSVQ